MMAEEKIRVKCPHCQMYFIPDFYKNRKDNSGFDKVEARIVEVCETETKILDPLTGRPCRSRFLRR